MIKLRLAIAATAAIGIAVSCAMVLFAHWLFRNSAPALYWSVVLGTGAMLAVRLLFASFELRAIYRQHADELEKESRAC